jgi:phenol hydroxylase P1 protein
MQFELRTQVIEPKRKTFTNLVERYGDRPASRYEEGSIDIQPVENFHYRPLYTATREVYDADYTAFKLVDPYSYIDPRQLYYAPYVQSRAAMNDAFVKSVDYVETRDLLQKLPAGWDSLVGEVLIPLRHWEAGAQLVAIEGSRWAYGTTIDQVCTYSAFDRIGNAQNISRIGIVYAEGHDHALVAAKEKWLGDPALQGLRRLVEEALAGDDWAKKLLTIDLADRLLYPLMYSYLDECFLVEVGVHERVPTASWPSTSPRGSSISAAGSTTWSRHGSPTPSTAMRTRLPSTMCSPPAGCRSCRPSPMSPRPWMRASRPVPLPMSRPPPPRSPRSWARSA